MARYLKVCALPVWASEDAVPQSLWFRSLPSEWLCRYRPGIRTLPLAGALMGFRENSVEEAKIFTTGSVSTGVVLSGKGKQTRNQRSCVCRSITPHNLWDFWKPASTGKHRRRYFQSTETIPVPAGTVMLEWFKPDTVVGVIPGCCVLPGVDNPFAWIRRPGRWLNADTAKEFLRVYAPSLVPFYQETAAFLPT